MDSEVEMARKKFDRIKGIIGDLPENNQIDRYACFEQIRNGLLNNEDFSAHTIDFGDDVKRLNSVYAERGYLDHSIQDNSHNNTRILRHLNDSHQDIDETAENIKFLDYRSTSKLIR